MGVQSLSLRPLQIKCSKNKEFPMRSEQEMLDRILNFARRDENIRAVVTVSYTHLTLPTIYSV